MKRWGIVLGLILGPATFLAWLWLAPKGLPAEADRALERYVDLMHRMQGEELALRAAGRAAQPGAMRPWWSARVIGDSARYRVDLNFAGTPLAPPTPAAPGEITSAAGGIPLPYPPGEVWCVTFQAEPAGAARPVLLARHEDLYNAAWLVHELAENSLAWLGRLRCPDGLAGWPPN